MCFALARAALPTAGNTSRGRKRAEDGEGGRHRGPVLELRWSPWRTTASFHSLQIIEIKKKSLFWKISNTFKIERKVLRTSTYFSFQINYYNGGSWSLTALTPPPTFLDYPEANSSYQNGICKHFSLQLRSYKNLTLMISLVWLKTSNRGFPTSNAFR